MGLLTAANVTTPIDTSLPGVPASLAAADDVCRDRSDIYAVLEPLGPVNQAVDLATSDTIRSALERRIQVMTSVIGDLERYEPSGSWGADMKTQLLASFQGVTRSDQAHLEGQPNSPQLDQVYEQLRLVVVDLGAPFC
jgi:hypothetical protein